ncbi:hypothetical protein EG328_001175 [Venturia inaequalis]|uniref:Uncharacterized protein n=1 Tax=Venturia inaequalis TaxID=5025 RepID=A0A8H3V0R5_VENIN|nr:hypothetical protein EG328_001175 [Venturia inaequalis]
MKKCYFIVPSTAYPPGGPLTLGSVLSDFEDPESVINPNEVVPLPESMMVMQSAEYDTIRASHSSSAFRAGIFAKWLDGMGLDISLGRHSDAQNALHFVKLDRTAMIPDESYVDKVVQTPAVEAYIKASKFRANLYMITGIQVAIGARQESSRTSGGDGTMSLGIDGTAEGFPGASIGPSIAVEGSAGEQSSFQGSTDFVYAYRVKEVKYRKNKFVMKDKNKGQTYSKEEDDALEKQRQADQEKQETGGEIKVVGLSKDEVDVKGLQAEAAIDSDGEKVEAVFVKRGVLTGERKE